MFVHIHRVKQWLVVPGLEFVGTYQEAIRVFLNPVRDQIRWKPIERRFGHSCPGVIVLSGKRDNRLVWAFAFFEVIAERMKVLERSFNAASYDHRSGLSTNF